MDEAAFGRLRRLDVNGEDLWYDSTEDYTVWRTKDGRLVRITEMTDSHLRNTIRAIELGRVLPMPRIAQDKNTGEAIQGMSVVAEYRAMQRRRWLASFLAEAKRRGLDLAP